LAVSYFAKREAMETSSTYTPPPGVGGKVTGWLSETFGDGAAALCQTICSPCVLLIAIVVLFQGEYTFVKDKANILEIQGDMVDDVTVYDAANEGLPVAFYMATATADPVQDPNFKVRIENAFKLEREAYMVTCTTTSTKTSDGGTLTEGTLRWTSTTATSSAVQCGNAQAKNFKSPCPSGSSCDGSWTAQNLVASEMSIPSFLVTEWTSENTAVVTSAAEWGTEYQAVTTGISTVNMDWFECGSGNYLSNNYRETYNSQPTLVHGTQSSPVCISGDATIGRTSLNGVSQYTATQGVGYDHSVSWEAWKFPADGFTICSKQTSKTFDELKSDGSYDQMLKGKKTKQDCIDAMHADALGAVMAARCIGFLLFWCGFCMMFSLVSFFADRLGSLIPCGLGEMLSDCVDCLITIVTCPPAFACWLFWWSLAWLIFNPIPYGIFFAVAVVLMGGMYWWFQSQEDGKEQPEKMEPEEPMADSQPWTSDQTPTQPPPPADNGDADGDGIPDQFQTGLPPGWTAAIDHSSNRVYWVNHNTVPASSTWQDPRTPIGAEV